MAGLFFSFYNIKMQTLEFNSISLFPTIIGSCVNVPLSEKVLPYAKEVLGNPQNLTNIGGYKNTFLKNIPETLIYDELKSFILDVSKSFSNLINSDFYPKNVHLFFSEMNKGDQHPYHAHPNSVYSGVFYLDVPENSAYLRFHDPRPYANFILYNSKHPSAWPMHDIKPQTGLFLIWQSWMPHEVLKNFTDGRSTAVFNIN
jgi:uncharacterized protein (TIGR02466 family)